MTPVLAGGFLTIEPPGKSPHNAPADHQLSVLHVFSRVRSPEGEEAWLRHVFYSGFRGLLLKAYCVPDPELGFQSTDRRPWTRGLSVQTGETQFVFYV